jgi:hypothetical protein
MSNILQWLYPDKLRFSSAQIRAGEPYPVYVQSRSNTVSIRFPSGKQERLPVTSNPLVFRDTREVGLYRITEGDKKRYFAVNLADASESNIRPPAQEVQDRMETLINESSNQTGATVMVEKPLWFLFLIVVVGALVLEGYVWLKRQ